MLRHLKNLLQAEIDPAFAKRAEFIFREISKEKPQRVLDVGCGRGFYVNALTFFPFVREIHGIDINEQYLGVARAYCFDDRVTLKKASVYQLPYPSGYFDFIICSEVLEHLRSDREALLEIKRVLKKDGTLVLTVPNYNFPFLWDPLNWVLMKVFNTHINKNIWWLAGIWADHERLYTEKQMRELVGEVGLQVENVLGLVRYCFPFTHFLLYGIGKNLVERVGLKEFDRFSIEGEKRFSRFLATLFALPSRLFDKSVDVEDKLTIAVLAKKVE